MAIVGGILGFAVAGAAGWLLGSWLAFVISALPLVALGMLFGGIHDMYEQQRRFIDTPELIDVQADELMRAGQWREASRVLLHAAKLVEQAAREPRPDREAVAALAARWEARARTCIHRDVNVNYERFRAWRKRERDPD
jgi:hypothetical protein